MNSFHQSPLPSPRARNQRLNRRLRNRRGGRVAQSFAVPVRGLFVAGVIVTVGWAYLVVVSLEATSQPYAENSVHPKSSRDRSLSDEQNRVEKARADEQHRRLRGDVTTIHTGHVSIFPTEKVKIKHPVKELKLPTPIIVVGLPKSGTTSIREYFRCGAIKSSHFSCEVDHFDTDAESWRNCRLPRGAGGPKSDGSRAPLCSVCVERNILRGRPPLEGCGSYKVWAELDSAEHPLPVMKPEAAVGFGTREYAAMMAKISEGEEESDYVQPLCSYPQITHLDKIHEAYPNATFILNLRPVEKWIKSVSKWNGDSSRTEKGYLRQVLTSCDFPGFPSGVGGSDDDLAAFYNDQSTRIRDFVRRHTSHTLVEVDIEKENAGKLMEDKFGISSKCWEKQNSSPTRLHRAAQSEKDNGTAHSAAKELSQQHGHVASNHAHQAVKMPRVLGQQQNTLRNSPPKGSSGKKKDQNLTMTEAMGQVQDMADLMFRQYTQQKEYNEKASMAYPECTELEDIFPPMTGDSVVE